MLYASLGGYTHRLQRSAHRVVLIIMQNISLKIQTLTIFKRTRQCLNGLLLLFSLWGTQQHNEDTTQHIEYKTSPQPHHGNQLRGISWIAAGRHTRHTPRAYANWDASAPVNTGVCTIGRMMYDVCWPKIHVQDVRKHRSDQTEFTARVCPSLRGHIAYRSFAISRACVFWYYTHNICNFIDKY